MFDLDETSDGTTINAFGFDIALVRTFEEAERMAAAMERRMAKLLDTCPCDWACWAGLSPDCALGKNADKPLAEIFGDPRLLASFKRRLAKVAA